MKTPKIIIAPDSFKGTIRATGVCDIWRRAFAASFPEANLVLLPMSDGGEGALDAIAASTNANRVSVAAKDPLSREITAQIAIFNGGKSAFIETAAACGIELITSAERNPMLTSSYGAGQLIAAALDAGVTDITVAIGGSATVDGGTGMLQALGFRFLDAQGSALALGGQMLNSIASIDASNAHPKIASTRFRIASDVTNPLLGSDGAAAVFGPQKGATPAMIPVLEQGLANFAEAAVKAGYADDCKHPGDGAAGGMGFALRAFLKAEAHSGAALIAELIGLETKLADADLLITGEGRTDRQTLFGKLPAFVAELAAKHGIPTVLCSGAIEDAAELRGRFDAVFGTVPGVAPLETVLAKAEENLYNAAASIASLLKINMRRQSENS